MVFSAPEITAVSKPKRSPPKDAANALNITYLLFFIEIIHFIKLSLLQKLLPPVLQFLPFVFSSPPSPFTIFIFMNIPIISPYIMLGPHYIKFHFFIVLGL